VEAAGWRLPTALTKIIRREFIGSATLLLCRIPSYVMGATLLSNPINSNRGTTCPYRPEARSQRIPSPNLLVSAAL
jgi:hypothetical protein